MLKFLYLLKAGHILSFSNLGYNNLEVRVTREEDKRFELVVLPNDHLNDSDLGEYIELMVEQLEATPIAQC